MDTKQPKSLGKKIGTAAIAVVAALFAIFFFYTENYYHTDADARAAMQSEDSIYVSQAALGYFFDGPGSQDLLIFYPGAKVEETAYAPLLRRLAEEGTDVYLVAMPQRLALFGKERAAEVFTEKVVDQADPTAWRQIREIYENFYIGGHSLGGAMAARYAAEHAEQLDGLILLAAYADQEIPDEVRLLSIYGSEDGVLNRAKYEENKANLPENYQEVELAGGNHAQFGNYGKQRGDGAASISAEEQQKATVDAILSFWEAE